MSEALEIPNVIETALQKNGVTDAVIAKLKGDYSNLKISDINDKEGYRLVDEGRKNCKVIRVMAAKVCKAGREEAIKIQKDWIAKEKEVTSQIGEVEDYLQSELDRIDQEREQLRLEAERKEKECIQGRVNQLVQYDCVFDGTKYVISNISITHENVVSASDEVFAAAAVMVKAEHDKIIAQRLEAERMEQERIEKEAEERKQFELKKAEQERIEREQQEKTAELKRQAEELERKKQEMEMEKFNAMVNIRISHVVSLGFVHDFSDFSDFSDFCHPKHRTIAISTEQISSMNEIEFADAISDLSKQIAEADELAKQAAEKTERIRKEQEAAAEAKRKQDIEDAREAARLEAIAEAKAEQERKDREAEEHRKEAERQAALRPDKDKLLSFSETIARLALPAVDSEAAQKIVDDIRTMIGKMQSHILIKVKNL